MATESKNNSQLLGHIKKLQNGARKYYRLKEVIKKIDTFMGLKELVAQRAEIYKKQEMMNNDAPVKIGELSFFVSLKNELLLVPAHDLFVGLPLLCKWIYNL